MTPVHYRFHVCLVRPRKAVPVISPTCQAGDSSDISSGPSYIFCAHKALYRAAPRNQEVKACNTPEPACAFKLILKPAGSINITEPVTERPENLNPILSI